MSWLTDTLKALLAPMLAWAAGWFKGRQDARMEDIEHAAETARKQAEIAANKPDDDALADKLSNGKF